MTTAATSHLAKLQENLETLVAASASFRTACGITGSDGAALTAAKARVYWMGANIPDTAARPLAWIRLDPGTEGRGEDSGGAGWWTTGKLSLFIELDMDKDDDARTRTVKFWNTIGAIVEDLQTLAKTEGYLWATSITLDGATLSDPAEERLRGFVALGITVF